MKKQAYRYTIFAFICLIISNCIPASAAYKDSIQYAIMDRSGEHYFTIADNHTSINRWQKSTGRLLTSYEPHERILRVFPDNGDGMLVGAGCESFVVWNLLTGKIAHEIPYPVDFKKYMADWCSRHVYMTDCDYDPAKKTAAVCSGKDILVMNVATGAVVFQHSFEYIIENIRLFNNSEQIVATETMTNRLFTISLATHNVVSIKTNLPPGTGVETNTTKQKFLLAENGMVSVYDADARPIFELKNAFITPEGYCSFLDTFNAVAVTHNRSTYIHLLQRDFGETTISINRPVNGFSAANGNILFWSGKWIGIRDYTGQNVYNTDNYAGPAAKESGVLSFGKADSLITLKTGTAEIVLPHKNAVCSYSNGKTPVTGDSRGNIYDWTTNGSLINRHEVLSDAITHIQAVSSDVILAGGYSRIVEYNLKTKQVGRVFRGHSGCITGSFYNEKLNLLLTGARDKHIFLWDFKTGDLIRSFDAQAVPHSISLATDNTIHFTDENGAGQTLPAADEIKQYLAPERKIIINSAHNSAISSLSFSSDGEKLLSTDREGIIKIWDVNNLVALKVLFFDNNVKQSLFTKDGKDVICFTQNNIFVANARTGTKISEAEIPALFKGVKIHTAALHPNNRILYLDNNMDKRQILYNLNTGKFYNHHYSEHQYAPYGIAASPDGKHIATYGNNIIIRDANTGVVVKEIVHPNRSSDNMYVNRLIQYSPDGKLLLLANDKGVRIWNLETNQEQMVIPEARVAAFTGNGRVAYYGYPQLAVKNVYTGDLLFSKEIPRKSSITNLAYDSVHNFLAIAIDKDIRILNASNGNVIKANRINATKTSGELNPANGGIAMGIPGKIMVFDWLTGREKKTIELKNYQSVVPNIKYSSNGKMLVAFSSTHETEVYDGSTYDSLFRLPAAITLKISNDGRFFALSNLGDFFLFDITKSKETPVLTLKDVYDDFEFTPDNRQLFMVNRKLKKNADKLADYESKNDISFTVYELTDMPKKMEIPVPDMDADHLNITADGKYVFYESSYSSVKVIDVQLQKQSAIRHFGPIDFMKASNDSKSMIIGDDEGNMYVYDIAGGKMINELRGHNGPIKSVSFWKNYIFSSSVDGSGIVWDAQTHKKVVQISPFATGDYIFIDKDHHYTGTSGISKAVFFQQQNKIYSFEQYDLIYNRPDLVVKSIDPQNTDLYNAYHKAYIKRVSKMGFNPDALSGDMSRPEVRITNPPAMETTDATLGFSINAVTDTGYLERVNVWINNIPVYGASGISLKGQKLRSLSRQLSVDLSAGINKIQVSCHNDKGIESLKGTFEITYNPPVKSKPDLYIIAISVSAYADSSYRLKYASKDGRDMVNAFLQKDNTFSHIIVDTFFDKDATKEKILSVKTKLSKSKPDDQVIIFISGHGLLDKNSDFYYATYDCIFKDPAKRGLAYDQIDALLDGIPARQKLLLMDACHSGEVDKPGVEYKQPAPGKPASTGPAVATKGLEISNESGTMVLAGSFLLMQDLFANLNRGSGAVVISAATGDGYALESDEWQNGAFTRAILAGLANTACDMNKDGAISITELQRYVYKKVTEDTKGRQKPTTRQDNLEFDWKLW